MFYTVKLRGSSIPSMSESGPVTHLYRYAASSGLRRQEPVSGPARDVLSLATSGGIVLGQPGGAR